ncbi:MAG: carboxypeptidase-like regulatory domain-containing protein [Bacteroidota bacterium]|nr:carboxypeptidase-like regulatory domain-containing protein [Bacteroidota bacterium]
MKKIITALMALLLLQTTQHCFAQQQKEISGKVLDANNAPLINASVLIQGKKAGTQTNSDGIFIIPAKTGEFLVISAVGYASQRIRVGSSNFLNVKMATGNNTLEEVTVAMDQKRNPRELGYAVQSVSGKVVAETQRENFVNGLEGRVAGLTVLLLPALRELHRELY